jgi:hypothetical protein
MVAIHTLFLPILLSAVAVFIASALIHMSSPLHKKDYGKVPNEEKVMDALRAFSIPPGDYLLPRPEGPKDMKSPEFKEKMNKGPVMMMSVWPTGMPGMGRNLILWFIYCLGIGVFAAYVSGRALQVGAPYLSVFRFAGTTALLGYSAALWQMSIWYRRPWGTTIRLTIDGIVYALLTAGMFGWLWPR